jgi:hypothetical protein
MTSLELQTKKADLVRSILNSDNEEIINKLSDLYKKLTVKNYPCDYTQEEILQSCKEAIEEYKAGGGTPHDKIKRKVL